jgi:dCTP deaminase
MILSNVEIVAAIKSGGVVINPQPNLKLPNERPFNTTSIDLRLGKDISVPRPGVPVTLNPASGGIARYLADNSDHYTLTQAQPYVLKPHQFLLGRTKETIGFPIRKGLECYSARVEGKSSLARCGILVHFTAPTIHAGFQGTVTLEIINLGSTSFQLEPDTYVCQLIIEEVKGIPVQTPTQFSGQSSPAGI